MPIPLDPVDIWRYVNSVLAITAFIWLLLDIKKHYAQLNVRRLYLTLALLGFLFVVAESSIESVVYQLKPGPRLVLTTAACIWTLLGLWIGRIDDEAGARGKQGL